MHEKTKLGINEKKRERSRTAPKTNCNNVYLNVGLSSNSFFTFLSGCCSRTLDSNVWPSSRPIDCFWWSKRWKWYAMVHAVPSPCRAASSAVIGCRFNGWVFQWFRWILCNNRWLDSRCSCRKYTMLLISILRYCNCCVDYEFRWRWQRRRRGGIVVVSQGAGFPVWGPRVLNYRRTLICSCPRSSIRVIVAQVVMRPRCAL